MKLNLFSVALLGAVLLLTDYIGDEFGNNSSISPKVDVNNIQNLVVNTRQEYLSSEENLPNAAKSVVMASKMKGSSGEETQETTLLLNPKTEPSAKDWPIGLGGWCREDC